MWGVLNFINSFLPGWNVPYKNVIVFVLFQFCSSVDESQILNMRNMIVFKNQGLFCLSPLKSTEMRVKSKEINNLKYATQWKTLKERFTTVLSKNWAYDSWCLL